LVINIIEIIGYIASVMIAVSLMMKGIVKLRIINLIGSAVFTIYGFIINAYPVAFVNGVICFVNIYYLYDMFKAKEYFKILEVKDSAYLNYFLNFHADDIKKFMPHFNFALSEKSIVFFILRNSVPAGLICAESLNNKEMFITLDYVIPGYRDMKVGKYVYDNIFDVKKISKIYTEPGNSRHDNYLQAMGFEKTEFNSKISFCLEKK